MVCFCVCVRGLGGSTCVCLVCELLCAVLWCVLFVSCVRDLCVCKVLRVVYCVMLYGLFLFVFVCVDELLICLCDVFMIYCVLSYGLCLCCCAFVRVGLNVFVRLVCDLLCDVV